MASPQFPPRIVTFVLVTPDGTLCGALPPVEVATPWWPDARGPVEAARRIHGVEVTILRLLEARDPWPGGRVTYLAEVDEPVAARPWTGTLAEHPLRLPWARPGGPRADLAWADDALARCGLQRSAPAEQVKSWNLSSLWRLPLADGSAWFKSVPPFFEHEGAMLELLAGGPVPRLLARAGRRMLLREIPGDDLYEADDAQLRVMVEQLVELQSRFIGRTAELLALGLPDWRGPALASAIADVVEREAEPLPSADRQLLDRFVTELPRRFARLADCGVPDTLVHGDFHPGNHRGRGTSIVLLDWGDCGVGHPLLDEPAFFQRMTPERVPPLRAHWHALWRATWPSTDPERAARLLEPVAAARQAVIYRHFLDQIEPTEHPYHRDDPLDWLATTARLVRA